MDNTFPPVKAAWPTDANIERRYGSSLGGENMEKSWIEVTRPRKHTKQIYIG
jgi:hypothetical protein